MRSVKLLFVFLCLALNSGCAIESKAHWRAGAWRADFEDVKQTMPRDPGEVDLFFRQGFGWNYQTEVTRFFACSTTTVMRKAFLVDTDRSAVLDRSVVGLAHITTEEFPRDEKASETVEPPEFSTVFGRIGTEPMDLFTIQLDPAFLEDALDRLRHYAGMLGADAVIGVFATGEAEYHMWEGTALSFNRLSTHSLLYSSGALLDFRLRDVRLHGVAVRYDD